MLFFVEIDNCSFFCFVIFTGSARRDSPSKVGVGSPRPLSSNSAIPDMHDSSAFNDLSATMFEVGVKQLYICICSYYNVNE